MWSWVFMMLPVQGEVVDLFIELVIFGQNELFKNWDMKQYFTLLLLQQGFIMYISTLLLYSVLNNNIYKNCIILGTQ